MNRSELFKLIDLLYIADPNVLIGYDYASNELFVYGESPLSTVQSRDCDVTIPPFLIGQEVTALPGTVDYAVQLFAELISKSSNDNQYDGLPLSAESGKLIMPEELRIKLEGIYPETISDLVKGMSVNQPCWGYADHRTNKESHEMKVIITIPSEFGKISVKREVFVYGGDVEIPILKAALNDNMGS